MEIDQTTNIAIKIKNIPMPPSVNQAYIQGRYRRCLSKSAEAWYRTFLAEMKALKARKMAHDRLIVGAEFYFRYPKKCDTSNYTKLLWDGLQKAGIIVNDSQFFWDLCQKKKAGKDEPPYVDLTIMSLGVKFNE